MWGKKNPKKQIQNVENWRPTAETKVAFKTQQSGKEWMDNITLNWVQGKNNKAQIKHIRDIVARQEKDWGRQCKAEQDERNTFKLKQEIKQKHRQSNRRQYKRNIDYKPNTLSNTKVTDTWSWFIGFKSHLPTIRLLDSSDLLLCFFSSLQKYRQERVAHLNLLI